MKPKSRQRFSLPNKKDGKIIGAMKKKTRSIENRHTHSDRATANTMVLRLQIACQAKDRRRRRRPQQFDGQNRQRVLRISPNARKEKIVVESPQTEAVLT